MLVDHGEEHGWQSQENEAREPAFASQCGLNLAHDAEAVADQFPDLVENFRQVAARLPLQNHGRDEEPQVEIGHPLDIERRLSSMLTPRFCSSKTRPNSLPTVSLISAGHGVEAEAQALPGAEGCGRSFPRRRESCMLKVFIRFLRRKRSHNMGSDTGGDGRQRGPSERGLFMAIATPPFLPPRKPKTRPGWAYRERRCRPARKAN